MGQIVKRKKKGRPSKALRMREVMGALDLVYAGSSVLISSRIWCTLDLVKKKKKGGPSKEEYDVRRKKK